MAGQYRAYLPNLSSSPQIQDRQGSFENIRNIQPDGMNTHEVGLNLGGLLNSDNTGTNQVISDTNPSNYSFNIVRTNSVAFRPTSKPHVSSGTGTGGTKCF